METNIPQPATQELNNDTATIVTVLLLIFIFPVGLIVMWLWPKWKTWVKVVITFPIFIFLILGILASIILIAINPAGQIRRAECTKLCNSEKLYSEDCVTNCLEKKETESFEEEKPEETEKVVCQPYERCDTDFIKVSKILEEAQNYTVIPTLSNYQKWCISLGAVTAERNMQPESQLSLIDPKGSLGGEEMQLSLIKGMLVRDWEINSPGSALQVISNLVNMGHSVQYIEFYKVILRYPELTSEQLLDKLIEESASRPEGKILLSELDRIQQIDAFEFVKSNNSTTGSNLIYAWDYGRAIYVVRAAYSAGYIDEREAMLLIEEIGNRVKKRFVGWYDFAENYKVGRMWWGINSPNITKETEDMVSNANKFWANIPWEWSRSE